MYVKYCLYLLCINYVFLHTFLYLRYFFLLQTISSGHVGIPVSADYATALARMPPQYDVTSLGGNFDRYFEVRQTQRARAVRATWLSLKN